MKELLDKVKNQFAESLPFVVYCKPNSDTITGLFQLDANLYSVENFNEKGFVFASFDGNQICLIPEKHSEKVSFGFDKKDIFFSEKEFNTPEEKLDYNKSLDSKFNIIILGNKKPEELE